MIKPSEFMHPEDAAALDAFKAIPGFTQAMKLVMKYVDEMQWYGENIASSIRLSPLQLPEIYRHLPPICARLGIEEPEFYLKMDPIPNAWTYGDTRVFITLTSGLVEALDDEELDAFLFSLGCYAGEPITVVSRRRGSMTVAIKDGRYTIDNQLAEAIQI